MDLLDGPGAYQAAIQELDLWYDRTSRLVEQQEKEVLSWPKIGSEREGDQLKAFALKLHSVLVSMKSCGMQPGRQLHLAATQKVPTSVLLRYFELHIDAEYDMQSFADWLMRRVHILHQVSAPIHCWEGTTELSVPNTSYGSSQQISR